MDAAMEFDWQYQARRYAARLAFLPPSPDTDVMESHAAGVTVVYVTHDNEGYIKQELSAHGIAILGTASTLRADKSVGLTMLVQSADVDLLNEIVCGKRSVSRSR